MSRMYAPFPSPPAFPSGGAFCRPLSRVQTIHTVCTHVCVALAPKVYRKRPALQASQAARHERKDGRSTHCSSSMTCKRQLVNDDRTEPCIRSVFYMGNKLVVARGGKPTGGSFSSGRHRVEVMLVRLGGKQNVNDRQSGQARQRASSIIRRWTEGRR